MKKLIIALAIAISLTMAAPAMAIFGDTTNNYDSHDTYEGDTYNKGGQGGKGGTGIGIGIGKGGNATIQNSGNTAIGNTLIGDTFSPKASATIEKGAVKVNNKNTNLNCNKNTNVNVNKNKNVNKNTNIQGQKQGQVQGQGQGQAQKNVLTIIEAETKREHIGGSAFKADVGKYSDRYHYGAEFLPVSIITAFKYNFSFEAAYEDYGRKYGEGKCKTTGHSYNGRHEDDPSETIDVFDAADFMGENFTVVGFLTVKAVKEGTDSFMVMQKAILSAALMQGDAIVVTSEGASMEPRSSGWGIGTFFSGGQVADHGNRGNATSAGGGTGFSKTSASLVTLPWMTVQVIKYN